MKHEKDKEKRLWVYNEDTGSVTKRRLVFKVNAVESWYDDVMNYHGHDPFYVDNDKEALIKRVHNSLAVELQETLNNVEKLLTKIRKLTKKV